MAVHDYVLDNATGANFRSDLNNALAAIVSNNSNSSEPSTKYAYQWWVDTTANIVKIRNSANDGWINLFTTAGGIDVDSASNFSAAVTFTDDVTFDGATAGRDIVFDRSDNALEFADSAKATFGSSADLSIYHDGSHSYIQDSGTGHLRIRGDDIEITDNASNNNMAKFIEGGAVELFFNNAKKAETVTGGFTITGVCTATSFAGDGSNLTGVGATTINSNADNKVITGSGTANTLNAEGGLTFDGSTLTLSAATPAIKFDENDGNPDYQMSSVAGEFYIDDTTNNETRFKIKSNGDTVLRNDVSGQFQIAMKNLDTSANASAYVILSWNLNRTGGGIDQAAGYILVSKNQEWVTTSANSDANMVFATINNESITTKALLSNEGHFMVGTTNPNIGTSAATEGVAIREEGHVVSRGTSSNPAMFTSKVTDTGTSKALRCMLAQTEMGSITYSGGGVSFNTSSDYRRKENVVSLTDAITRLKTLLPKRFNFIDEPSVTRDGFLAHEVTAVPEAVTGAKDAVATETEVQRGVVTKVGDPIYQQLDNTKLIPLLVASVKELIARVETLEAA